MSLILERYEIKRQIDQLSERLKEIDEEILAEAEEGEVLDVGNGGYYRVSVTRKKQYPPHVALMIPSKALPEVVKLSESGLEKLVKQRLLDRDLADEIHRTAEVKEAKTLGTFKAHKEAVLEDLQSE